MCLVTKCETGKFIVFETHIWAFLKLDKTIKEFLHSIWWTRCLLIFIYKKNLKIQGRAAGRSLLGMVVCYLIAQVFSTCARTKADDNQDKTIQLENGFINRTGYASPVRQRYSSKDPAIKIL